MRMCIFNWNMLINVCVLAGFLGKTRNI